MKKVSLKRSPILYNTEELILVSARKDLNDKLIKKAERLIREGVDWERFCYLAIKSQAGVLVYNSLKVIALINCIPQDVFDKLRTAYSCVILSAAGQHKKATDLLKLLAIKDIAAIPLKGTFLSKRIYGDIESRGASVDIDIFIRWKDRSAAHTVLIENGYLFRPAEEFESWLWQENYIGPGHQIIDVIYDIWLRGFRREAVAGLWNGTIRTADSDGFTYSEFGDEELIIHMFQGLVTSDNGYKCLRYICDINEFLERHSRSLNWESVINKAKKWRLRGSVYTAISLAGDLFNSNVPSSVINDIRPSFFKRVFIKAFFNRKVMLRENFRRRLMDSFLSYIFFELIEAASFSEYRAIIKRVFFPPPEVLGIKDGDPRPLRLRYSTRILKGMFKVLTLQK